MFSRTNDTIKRTTRTTYIFVDMFTFIVFHEDLRELFILEDLAEFVVQVYVTDIDHRKIIKCTQVIR